MALTIDNSRALRTPAQLLALARAVHEASPEDESRCIEWKSAYDDITSASASFAVGRAILGLANRAVAVAGSAFEGVGYVLVGVEPGAVAGQKVPDSAELFNAVQRYTGHGRPYWDAHTVELHGESILVIVVEPPRDGDRIWLLQKGYQAPKGTLVPEGTIFVRQVEATERASRIELDMLQDRLLSGSEAEAAALREATQKSELRELIADLVHAGKRWTDTAQILLITSASTSWTKNDMAEWVNTDSGREMTADAQVIKRNVRKIRLSTVNPLLVGPALDAQQCFEGGKIFDPVHRDGPSEADDRVVSYQSINAMKAALDALESNAIELLAHIGN